PYYCCLLFVVLFLLMIRRPPRSTLFPSRRSSDLRRRRHLRRSRDDDGACGRAFLCLSDLAVSRAAILCAERAAATSCRLIGKHGDRKSTRLNSSHVSISYAVFCLKKKI